MDKNIFEEGPRRGHAAGDTSLEQQASQLASDIKYKARQKMKGTSGSNMSPGQVQQLYRQLLNASPAPGGVKAIVKKKLFGEQVDPGVTPVSEHVKDSTSSVFTKVFSEGADQKFVIRVTDKATGNTSYRKADRAKVAELRANPNISSVEITGRKEADAAYDSEKGGKKAKKDYDGDGKIESGTAEYMGSRDKAIKKAMAKEEVIYEKEEKGEKKIDVMKKGETNNVVVNPVSEEIKAKLDALKAEKLQEQEDAMKQQQNAEKQKEKEAQLAKQNEAKEKQAKQKMMLVLRSKMRALRSGADITASHHHEGDTISEGEGAVRYCPKCDKDETREECRYGGEYWDENSKPAKAEDPRSMGTKVRLARNKLRLMGLKMSYDMEGESIDEVTYPSDFIDKRTGKKKDVATSKTGRPQQHDEPMSGGRRKTVDETSDLDQMQKDADANRARAAKLKDRNVTRASASFAAAKAADTVKKAAKYGPQQHKGTKTGAMRVEETEDSLRDRRMERGGVDGNTRYDRAPKAPNTKKFGTGKTMAQKEMEKKYGKGATAMDIVKAQIRSKYGKGAIMDK